MAITVSKDRGGKVGKSSRRQIKVLCLPKKAKKINAGKSRQVLLKARRVKAVTPAGNEYDDNPSRKRAVLCRIP